ncbi:MAG: CoB--CoM heterodisulfide reductase iron-sulfur subunit B family protein [Desulfatiglans sp.]|jgi:heterodisulfide reductase subunit B|nr:CoB--CoM heterodisulfide reductase iron-sulfur subunit B family protein [Thermodesulfobacteriota bacterium]MEE4352703.1 CoB--CoM heterodisulfide reductase iron-sulfur subunit B family protein [Desulfatiglans sp.]
MMKFTLFLGCNIPVRVQQYELSARAVLDKLGVEIVDIREFNCCGYPLRNSNFEAFILSSARNLALAEQHGQSMMTLCKCCYGSLKKAQYVLRDNSALLRDINGLLAKEDLEYNGEIEIKHLLSVLHQDIGLDELAAKRTVTFKSLKIATHYGCHALRPSDITEFDNPVAPVLFDELVEATGATSIEWPSKLECCGAPAFGINDDLSTDLTRRKLTAGKGAGADYLCVACPYCQMQFDKVQKMMAKDSGENHYLASIVYPQLLGLAMGIDPDSLGIKMNELDISGLKNFLS